MFQVLVVDDRRLFWILASETERTAAFRIAGCHDVGEAMFTVIEVFVLL